MEHKIFLVSEAIQASFDEIPMVTGRADIGIVPMALIWKILSKNVNIQRKMLCDSGTASVTASLFPEQSIR